MVAWRAISRALGFVSVLLLANLLTPADFGIVAVATAVSGAIDNLSQLGVRDALVRLDEERTDYYNAAFTLQAARGLLTGLLIASAAGIAAGMMDEPRITPILLVLAASAAVSGFENIGIVSFSRALNFRMLFVLQIGPRLAGFAVTTLLALLLHSYWALVVGGVIARVSQVLSSYVVSPHRPRFGMAGWRYLLHFSFWTWLGGLVVTVLQRADSFLLGPVLGASVFGLYTIASEVALLPMTELLEPACTALFPGFALARRGGASPSAMGLSVAGALVLIMVPFSLGISACSGYLVTALLGPKWNEAQHLIAILAWMCMFLPFSWVTVTALSAQGRVRQVVASHALAAAIKVAAVLAVRETRDLRLITLATVAVVAAESTIFIWQLWAAGNRELRNLGGTMLRIIPSTAVAALVLSAIPGTWEIVTLSRPAALVAGGFIGLATFAVFFVSQAGLWFAFGRPPGAEQRIADILANDPIVARLMSPLRSNAPP